MKVGFFTHLFVVLYGILRLFLLFGNLVCVITIEEFAAQLTDEIKSDPKKIEDEFKIYCETAKSKQQRLVHNFTILIKIRLTKFKM